MTNRKFLAISLAMMLLLTVYRAWVIVHNQLPLYMDEAQYWAWSLKPDWGYYSKPPMVAWTIALTAALFGSGELAVRAGSLLLYLLSGGALYLLARRMFGSRTAAWSAALFISLPIIGFNSLFITTDAPLMFFWGVSVYGLWRAFESDEWRWWLLVGIAAGLGLLSKYTMSIFAVSAALAMLLPPFRRQWINPRLYAAAALAFLIFLPNLWWNAQMDFVSFRHTAEISRLQGKLFHLDSLAEFLGSQFACMGPVAFVFLLMRIAAPSVWRDGRQGYLAAMTLPFLAVISLQALLAKANMNWAAPSYFGAALLVASYWTQGRSLRWGIVAIATNLFFLSCFYHYHALAQVAGIELSRKSDPYARVLGWPEAGRELAQVAGRYPGDKVAVIRRDEFAWLAYYARLYPERLRIWNPEGKRQNHFHLFSDMRQDAGQNFIFASQYEPDELTARSFERWDALGAVDVPVYRDYSIKLKLYRGIGFKGYAP